MSASLTHGKPSPHGRVVTLGGAERRVGGWSEYEIYRREAAAGAGRPAYGGRRWVGAADVVDRAVAAAAAPRRGGGPAAAPTSEPYLAAALRSLKETQAARERETLQASWWEVNDSFSWPAEDLDDLADEIARRGYAGPAELRRVVDTVESLGSKVPPPGAPTPESVRTLADRAGKLQASLPPTRARTDDQSALAALGRACGPCASALEEGNAEAAAYVGAVSAAPAGAVRSR